jgi:hypothetical protein
MRYTRLFSSDDGESHFEDVAIEFTEANYVPLAPPLRLSASCGATSYRLMEAPAGWESDSHVSSARNFFVLLTGEWEVTASDCDTRRFGPGSLLLVEDTTGKGHKSRVVSESDSLALMLQVEDVH